MRVLRPLTIARAERLLQEVVAVTDASTVHDPPLNRSEQRRRMTRREIWTLIGVAAAGWVMLFALLRIWWRVYLVVSQ